MGDESPHGRKGTSFQQLSPLPGLTFYNRYLWARFIGFLAWWRESFHSSASDGVLPESLHLRRCLNVLVLGQECGPASIRGRDDQPVVHFGHADIGGELIYVL